MSDDTEEKLTSYSQKENIIYPNRFNGIKMQANQDFDNTANNPMDTSIKNNNLNSLDDDFLDSELEIFLETAREQGYPISITDENEANKVKHLIYKLGTCKKFSEEYLTAQDNLNQIIASKLSFYKKLKASIKSLI